MVIKVLITTILLQVKSKLKGHSKRITGLAFSHVLNVLVSSGADAQVENFFILYVCKHLVCYIKLKYQFDAINWAAALRKSLY